MDSRKHFCFQFSFFFEIFRGIDFLFSASVAEEKWTIKKYSFSLLTGHRYNKNWLLALISLNFSILNSFESAKITVDHIWISAEKREISETAMSSADYHWDFNLGEFCHVTNKKFTTIVGLFSESNAPTKTGIPMYKHLFITRQIEIHFNHWSIITNESKLQLRISWKASLRCN